MRNNKQDINDKIRKNYLAQIFYLINHNPDYLNMKQSKHKNILLQALRPKKIGYINFIKAYH